MPDFAPEPDRDRCCCAAARSEAGQLSAPVSPDRCQRPGRENPEWVQDLQKSMAEFADRVESHGRRIERRSLHHDYVLATAPVPTLRHIDRPARAVTVCCGVRA